jgi:hypothetical protein
LDWIGTVMGLVTLPMALFSALSVAAGIGLLAVGAGHVVLLGLLAFAAAYGIATLLERAVIRLDETAITVRRAHHVGQSRVVAGASGLLPMLVLLGWEIAAFQAVMAAAPAPRLLLWLWSYGVATGPWTVFALRADSARRTVCGIRAYAGHLAYWLLSVLVLAFGVPLPMAGLAMLLPAILPISVGFLLAVANRDALHNVRI